MNRKNVNGKSVPDESRINSFDVRNALEKKEFFRWLLRNFTYLFVTLVSVYRR